MISRAIPLAALALVAAASLAGCTGEPTTPVSTETSAAPSSSAPTETSAPPSSTPTPTDTATEAGPAIPTCETLVTSDQLYSYNPNYALATDAPGSGVRTCTWTADSADATITLHIEAGTSSTGTGTKIGGYDGTFSTKGSTGTAVVNLGDWHVDVASAMFSTVDDAVPFLDLVKGNLG